RVLFFEEPIFEPAARPRLDLVEAERLITIATPVLPEGLTEELSVSAQRALLDRQLASKPAGTTIVWHYTPMALSFTNHISPDLLVYDCMDELSAFKDAPPELIDMERKLFERA